MPRQSEPSPNREINVVRRLPRTKSLTAVRMAVSSVSRQLPTRLPRTLDLGAATDGYAHEQVPTEMSGQAIFDIMERCHGKNRDKEIVIAVWHQGRSFLFFFFRYNGVTILRYNAIKYSLFHCILDNRNSSRIPCQN